MHYVILRDDDTNAFTPVECLERLYRPWLDRQLPVNLSVIPEVSTAAVMQNGKPEGFLGPGALSKSREVQVGVNQELAGYLLKNQGYHIVQHGLHHEYLEFDSVERRGIVSKLEHGKEVLLDAGFKQAETFVAPYDRFSTVALREVGKRFAVVSSGWYEWRRVPPEWWAHYVSKVVLGRRHWRRGKTIFLTHPGCLLSYCRPYDTIFNLVVQRISGQTLTVLVTHWWEYFRGGKPDSALIDILHETAHWLGGRRDVKVISFADLTQGNIPLH